MLILFSGFAPYLLRKYTNPLCGSQALHRKPSRSFYNCAKPNTAIIIIKYTSATPGSLFFSFMTIYIILCIIVCHFNINRLLLNYYAGYISIYFVDTQNFVKKKNRTSHILYNIFVYTIDGVELYACHKNR